MSLARKQAIITFAAWLTILACFVSLFILTGVDSFAEPGQRWVRLLVAGIILPGYLLNLVFLHWSRKGQAKGELDERDEAIAKHASQATMIIMAILVFTFGIGLFETYRDVGVLSVGWLYILAYGSVATVSLVHPAVTLILDFGGKVDG